MISVHVVHPLFLAKLQEEFNALLAPKNSWPQKKDQLEALPSKLAHLGFLKTFRADRVHFSRSYRLAAWYKRIPISALGSDALEPLHLRFYPVAKMSERRSRRMPEIGEFVIHAGRNFCVYGTSEQAAAFESFQGACQNLRTDTLQPFLEFAETLRPSLERPDRKRAIYSRADQACPGRGTSLHTRRYGHSYLIPVAWPDSNLVSKGKQ